MPFAKKIVKQGGRQKGTPNKLTGEIKVKAKEVLQAMFFKVSGDFGDWYPNLSDVEKSDLLVKLAPYVAPKLSAVTLDTDMEVIAEIRLNGSPKNEDNI